jgi:hypothetical protein
VPIGIAVDGGNPAAGFGGHGCDSISAVMLSITSRTMVVRVLLAATTSSNDACAPTSIPRW